MLVAGEASGDLLAAELVGALRAELDAPSPFAPLAPAFFGAGGPRMAAAGVALETDLTAHAVIGFADVLRNVLKFRRLLLRLVRLAQDRLPDVIVCVDFSGFNRRFARAVRKTAARSAGPFNNWAPRIVQYVSPQVWASRPGRVRGMEADYDLLLTIFPFEKDWYARHAPALPVEFVGHPMLDRYPRHPARREPARPAQVLLLPGSRPSELRRHLPVLIQAAAIIRARQDVRFRMVLPNSSLENGADQARRGIPGLELQFGGAGEALAQADLALTKSGTITMECAFFGVPAVVFYITSRPEFEIGKRLVKVPYLAMPNLLAGAPLFPEFIQMAATPEAIAQAGLELLGNPARREEVRTRLDQVILSLGAPGASRRAARAILRLVNR
jgi:lipid-A-disaccharide synthase